MNMNITIRENSSDKKVIEHVGSSRARTLIHAKMIISIPMWRKIVFFFFIKRFPLNGIKFK